MLKSSRVNSHVNTKTSKTGDISEILVFKSTLTFYFLYFLVLHPVARNITITQ
jgi:hypothetical protein